jgi:ankyrin repeat protein
MLDEIRGVLSAGPQGTEPGKKKKVKESPFAYMPDYVKDMSKRDAAKKANKLKDYKPKADPNDLLSHYLNQPKQEVQFSKDEMREKVVIAPYIDTLVTVDQKLWMDDYTNAQKRKANDAEEEKKRIKEGRQGKENNKAVKRKHDVSHLVAGYSNEDPPPLPESGTPEKKENDDESTGTSSLPPPALPPPTRSGSSMSVLSFMKRYPRLCKACFIDKKYDLSTVAPRSDVWMSRFMEECYDEAYLFTSKPIADSRRRKRCGLDLGALDAFPLIIQRVLTRLFSTGELRERVCLEILVTIENVTKAAEAAQLAGTFGEHAKGMKGADSLSTTHESVVADIKIDGGRVPLFAKFLAEELDLDYLAMFLQTRTIVQQEVGVKLADATPTALNEVLHAYPDPPVSGAFSFGSTDEFRNSLEMTKNRGAARTNEVHGTTFQGVAEGPKNKVIPFPLPRNLHYIVDITLPHAQLVAVDISRLEWLVAQIVPDCTPEQKRYFWDMVVERADRMLEQSNKRLEMSLPLHTVLPHECEAKRQGIWAPDGGRYIPLYCIFQVVCEQWKEVPNETKNGFLPSGNVAGNLSDLNDIYDNGNARMRALAKRIADTEIELTEKEGTIMKMDKRKRRLERKWDNGVASADELMELQGLRVDLTDERAELTSIQSRLDGLLERQAALQAGIEGLWVAASSSTEVQDAPVSHGSDYSSSKLAPSQWKEEAMGNLFKAVVYNEECVRAVAEAAEKFDALGDEIVEEIKEKRRLQQEEEEAMSIATPEPTLEERLAAIEAEALELAHLGQNVAIENGMVPPPAPAYIQAYLSDKEQAELRRLEKEHERAAEESNRQLMHIEEYAMRQVLDEEAFRKAHARRVAMYKREKEEKALRMEVEATARRQTHRLVEDSVRRVAEEAMRRKMAELAADAEARQELLEEAMQHQAQLAAQLQIAQVVNSSVQLGMERVTQQLLEEARCALEAKMRVEAMQRRLVAVSETASDSVRMSVTSAVGGVTAAAVAELLRQQQLELARLRREEMDRAVQESKVKAAEASVAEAVRKAQEYFEEQEALRVAYQAQLEEQRVETLGLSVANELMALLVEEAGQEAVHTTQEVLVLEDQEREVAVKRAAIKAAKEEKALKYRIGRISRALVKMSFETAMINAKEVLTDPWNNLDIDPEEWLSEDTLGEVEEMFLISNMNRERKYKRAFFDSFGLSKAVRLRSRRFTEKWAMQELKEAYARRLLHDRMARKVARYVMLVVVRRRRHKFALQLQAKCETADEIALRNRKKRALKMIQWWKYWANCEARAGVVVFNIVEREFLKAFYTWKHKFNLRRQAQAENKKKRDFAATKILLLLKLKVRRRRIRRANAVRALQCMGQIFLARRQVAQMRSYQRALYDKQQFQRWRSGRYAVRAYSREWRRVYSKASFFNELHLFFMRKLVRRRFRLWKYGVRDRGKLVRTSTLLLQKTVRMWIIKRYVLNYYKWQRGLRNFQSHCRRRSIIPWFQYNLKLYRAARYIQRMYRGHYLRGHITDKRILDLHYAAGHNNYDKLLYYSSKFPELLFELDAEGNTAMHNAAKSAARRTLKLLLKHQLDPNALNLAGYSPLHLIIMSTAVNRDDCCMYMLDHGFDEEMLTPDGKTCLLLAVEYGRLKLVETMLENHLDPNQADNTGLTCLQAACQVGLFPILSLLVHYAADVNQPGYCGTFPLHDCISTGNIDFPNLLISHGAYVNVKEPNYLQTPLMWACRAGLAEFASLYVLQGASLGDKDYMGWSAAHHAALSGNAPVYESLRIGDADFDAKDNDGNTPMHIAGSYGNLEFTQQLLLGGADPAIQNLEGNQPSHIAARDNSLEALQAICVYDKHIGRLNFVHQTPLGLAKFHNSHECQAFLEKHYRMVEVEGGRNEIGEIWWDRDMDEVSEDWKVVVGFLGEREYVNRVTGERSLVPPSYPSRVVARKANTLQLPLEKAVVLVGAEGENNLTRHAYKEEYSNFGAEVEDLARLHRSATEINRFARRKLAYMEGKWLRTRKAKLKLIAKFIKRHVGGFMRSKKAQYNSAFSMLQAKFKGDQFRKNWHTPARASKTSTNATTRMRAEYEERYQKVQLSFIMARLWKRYKFMKACALLEIAPKVPVREDAKGWARLIKRARYVRRTVGVFEEYVLCSIVILSFLLDVSVCLSLLSTYCSLLALSNTK